MRWHLHITALVLCTAPGAVIAEYTDARDGGPRRLQLLEASALLKSPDLDAVVIRRLAGGAVLDNFGCASDWCHVRPFRGGTKGFVPATYLRPAEAPNGVVPMGIDPSRARARLGDFDAERTIPCAQERGQAMGTCKAAVARSDGGDATVSVTFSNGFTRLLFFAYGEFIAASATMSGTGKDVEWRLDAGTHDLRVEDQRFELPDAFVFGP